MERYSALRAEEMSASGKKFKAHNVIINPLAMFFRMYIAKRGFLDGVHGSGLIIAVRILHGLEIHKALEKEITN